jgi:hypothetical protein
MSMIDQDLLKLLTNGGDGAGRLVANIMFQRSELMKSLLDSPRNINADCGYPEGYIPIQLYQTLRPRAYCRKSR